MNDRTPQNEKAKLSMETKEYIHGQLYDLVNGNDMELIEVTKKLLKPYGNILDKVEAELSTTILSQQQEIERLKANQITILKQLQQTCMHELVYPLSMKHKRGAYHIIQEQIDNLTAK